jgi:cellular nucleic acid-binding protein
MLRLRKAGKPCQPCLQLDHYSKLDQGHISRDCTAPNGGPLSSAGKVCYKCLQAGHISRDCPTNETTAQPATESVSATATASTSVDGTADAGVATNAPTATVA